MDRSLDLDDRFSREFAEECEQHGVGLALLQGDLGRARPVPHESECDSPERAVLLEMAGDPDGRAVQFAQLTGRSAG